MIASDPTGPVEGDPDSDVRSAPGEAVGSGPAGPRREWPGQALPAEDPPAGQDRVKRPQGPRHPRGRGEPNPRLPAFGYAPPSGAPAL
jgi:hypothetical protein